MMLEKVFGASQYTFYEVRFIAVAVVFRAGLLLWEGDRLPGSKNIDERKGGGDGFDRARR